MALPVTFATLAAGDEALSLLDTAFTAIGAIGVIPCAAAGTNAITLTPFSNTPTIAAYTDLAPSFMFVGPASSTGSVTINVSGLGARNAYKWNAAISAQAAAPPAGLNDIQIGGIYKATFLTALNSGAGGFLVDTVGVGNNQVDLEFVIDGGGVAITTGAKGFFRVPWAATIYNWALIADQSGSITIDILRANNAVPTSSIVGGGTKPTLSSAQFAGLTAPSGWTSTSLVANDWVGFTVSTVATVTRVTVDLSLGKL